MKTNKSLIPLVLLLFVLTISGRKDKVYILNAEDVIFDVTTGTIESYINSVEKNISIPPSFIFKDKHIIVNAIGDKAFSGMSLSSVLLPKSVTIIDKYAFYNNNLKSIELPNNITYIGKHAFAQNFFATLKLPKNSNIGNNKWSDSNGVRYNAGEDINTTLFTCYSLPHK